MVNESCRLKSNIEQLEGELQSQLTQHKHELEEAEKTITSLLTRQSSDESAIAGLMSTIQELREESSKSEAKATSLSKEMEESSKELSAAASKIDVLVSFYMYRWPNALYSYQFSFLYYNYDYCLYASIMMKVCAYTGRCGVYRFAFDRAYTKHVYTNTQVAITYTFDIVPIIIS